MGIKTKIEYADSTINPVPGCSGCELFSQNPGENHCYAATLINRYAGKRGWPDSFLEPKHFPERLPSAIRWPDLTGTDRPDKPWLNGLPRIIFVNDLGDLFCPSAPDPWETLAPHLEAMAGSPHAYLVLTKWPQWMHKFLYDYHALNGEPVAQNILWGTTITAMGTIRRWHQLIVNQLGDNPYVLDKMRTWLSLEPLLGPVNLRLTQRISNKPAFVAAGGESGSNARPSHPDWFRMVRDDCQEAGVPFFFKQWGEWAPVFDSYASADGYTMQRLGKKDAGRKLDSQEWSQMPSFPKETGPCD